MRACIFCLILILLYHMKLLKTSIRKFLEQADILVDKPDNCWLWKGKINPKGGHGLFWSPGFSSAHRFSYSYFYGKSIPSGMQVQHICDVAACVNPHHLYLGTQLENVKDMLERDRHARGAKKLLTKKEVDKIVETYKSGKKSQSQMARELGISQTTISKWVHKVHRVNW